MSADEGASLLEPAAELECAGRLTAAARAGDGSALLIEGPAGIGKSALIHAIREGRGRRGLYGARGPRSRAGAGVFLRRRAPALRGARRRCDTRAARALAGRGRAPGCAGDRGDRDRGRGGRRAGLIVAVARSDVRRPARALLPPTAQPPSNDFSFGKVKRNASRGTAKLTVLVPGPGRLELLGTDTVKAANADANAAGEAKLSVRPKGAAKRKLADRGKAKVRVVVTFVPDGGDRRSRTTLLRLKRN